MSAIETCRTAALGGHVERCEDCAHERVAYNSCRNRHCPKCQGAAARQWLAEREAELLPVAYYHVVFTLPAAIGAIAFHNKAAVYDLLFRTAAETLTTIAADPKHLGARIGLTAVLHTWGSALTHHPHVHVIVPGGGLSPDGTRWIACRPGFFLPVRVLSRLFRRLFLKGLAALHQTGRLTFFGDLAPLADKRAFDAALAPLRRSEWVIFAKRPFAGPQAVLAYLARYTHRVAISNSRLIALDEAGREANQGLPGADVVGPGPSAPDASRPAPSSRRISRGHRVPPFSCGRSGALGIGGRHQALSPGSAPSLARSMAAAALFDEPGCQRRRSSKSCALRRRAAPLRSWRERRGCARRRAEAGRVWSRQTRPAPTGT